MTAEWVAQLTALGFAWGNRHTDEWATQFEKLEAYKMHHGDCVVPRGWAEDPALHNWVSTRRQNKRKLDAGKPVHGMTAEWVAQLTPLGLAWGKRHTDEWATQFAKLEAYKMQHGDCVVPRDWAEDPALHNWVRIQRTNKRKLDAGKPAPGMTAERAAQLTALGFAWGKRYTDEWATQFAKLEAYKMHHGDCIVPRDWAEDPALVKWVSKQRQNKRKLDAGKPMHGMTAERVAQLTALGLALGKRHTDEWATQFAKLEAYKMQHGDCVVPRDWAEAPSLYNWVRTQRTNKRKARRRQAHAGDDGGVVGAADGAGL
jgi:hypothetical protein